MSITMKSPNNFGNYSISDDGLTVNGGSSVFYVESSEVLNKTLYFECVLNWTSFGSHHFGFTIGDHEIYNILNYEYIRGSSVVFATDTYGRIMGIFFFYENGPYKDLISFITRMKQYNISEKDIYTLIDSGAFDSFFGCQ